MLNIFDRTLRKTAVLQNAFGVVETEKLNGLSTLQFSLPGDDPKNENCDLFCYAQYDDGALYRIMTPQADESDTEAVTYQCEHAVATLLDDVLFGSVVLSGLGTRAVLENLLDRQTVKRWVLADCDFNYQYDYGFENENLLVALFSVAELFTEYRWDFDTSVYPWRISLRKINLSAVPECYLRPEKNLLTSQRARDAGQLCTRLYCLGYGEGVNQLTIREVNGSLPYLQANADVVARYGVISRVFVDRSYEDARSLMERGRALLAQYQQPVFSASFEAADLFEATGDPQDYPRAGKVVRIMPAGETTYITEVVRNLDSPGDVQVTVSTVSANISDTVAALADRQRVEQVYSQGATQLYAQSVQANATTTLGAVMNFYIPDEMRIVNAVKAKISLDRFRSYSKATKGGGKSTTTSRVGGESTATSEAGGAVNETSNSGGGDSVTSGSGGKTTVSYAPDYKTVASSYPKYDDGEGIDEHFHTVGTGTMAHKHSIPDHTHAVELPTHRHSFKTSAHKHAVSIPAHAHKVDIPDHAHDIEQGIFQFGAAKTAQILVNGVLKGTMAQERELDLTAMLVADDGKIPRGRWMKIEIRPDDLAYVTIDLFVQGFVQSRGGETY